MTEPVDDSKIYMHMPNGKKYFPFAPRAEDIFIENIAHMLANKCRYNGACAHPTDERRMFYSVAEHSVYCSYIGPASEALERLLHDASEHVNGDLIRPLKKSPRFSQPFREVEHLNEQIISEAFGLVFPFPASVKVADEAVTTKEVDFLIKKDPDEDWTLIETMLKITRGYDIDIQCLTPYASKKLFMKRFNQLWDSEKNTRRTPRTETSFGCVKIV